MGRLGPVDNGYLARIAVRPLQPTSKAVCAVRRSSLAALLALLLPGCAADLTGTGSASAPKPAEHARISVTPASPGDTHAYPVAAARRDGRGYLLGFGGAEHRVQVRALGLGYPFEGTDPGGRRYIGPGADTPWTTERHGRYTLSFRTAARHFALRVWSRGGRFRVKADGRYVDTRTRSAGSDYASHVLDVAFDDAKRRTVQVELADGAWVEELLLPDDADVTPGPAPRGPSIYWLGDSFTAGVGAVRPGFDDLAHQASARLGLGEVTVDGLGGTGYLRANTAARFPRYGQRLDALRRAKPDIVVVGGSINDAPYPPAKVGQAAAQLFASLRRAAPQAKVIVVQFTPSYPQPAGFARINAAVLAAARKAPNVAGAYDLPHDKAVRDGTDVVSGLRLQRGDGHPTGAGHRVYGQLIAQFVSRRLKLAQHG
jgi:lysophospholipase L1-like esterase